MGGFFVHLDFKHRHMITAVIDLGTNTFHLLIADLSFEEPKILYKTNLPVKLGEGRINENIIIPEAFTRGIEALKGFKKEIDQHNVAQIRAIATSAIRSATNGNEFVNAAALQAGINITVINGDQEATYIYNGVKATGVIDATSLIIDIGGGSTEFILCNQSKVLWKRSYNLGAARLQQAYFHSDPISQQDQQAIRKKLEAELTALKTVCAEHKPLQLIGSAGAFETYATMIYEELDVKVLKSLPIDLERYGALSQQLINSTNQQRQNLKGLIKLRVDMIVIASLLTNYVLEMIKPEKLSLSTYDLKMGVLYTMKNLNA